MRIIQASEIEQAVAELCIKANLSLPEDVVAALNAAHESEPWPVAKSTLNILQQNIEAAAASRIPVCQDTGMACVFLEIGNEVFIEGDLKEAINSGVRKGYTDGYLRKSIVGDPLKRVNTNDNTPAAITTEFVPGDKVHLIVAPKGFGSENMSRIAMLKPADGVEGVKKFIIETMQIAGANPCPPVILGVGIGGSFDKAALLAKHALLRRIDVRNPDPYYAELETELLNEINALGIGPQGFGGRTTALGLNIEVMPTHVAGLPVAVNMSCHATRRAEIIL